MTRLTVGTIMLLSCLAISCRLAGANPPPPYAQSATPPESSHVASADSTAKPQQKAAKVVISKETMTLTVYDANDVRIAEYPVAMGLNYGNKKRVGDKKTPEGTFEVQQIQNASGWTHDFGDGKGVIAGAYGSHFIRLLTPPHRGIGIHGTHDPASIGTRATEGCIRLRNEDLLEFVKYVYLGLPVTITGSEKDRAAEGS